MPQSTAGRVFLSMIAATCVTLITNALDTSPTVSLVGATLAAAVPALITAGGPYGIGLGVGVTAAALGATYLGFTAVDVAADRPLTFPAPQKVEEPLVDGETTPSTGDVSVPDVIGKQYADAQAELTEANLNVDSEEVDSDEEPGTVVEQDPTKGTTVPEQTTVTLSVSQAQVEVLEVPNVRQQSETAARASLESLGFEVVVSLEAVSDDVLIGVVLAQSPVGGSLAPAGAQVTLMVGAAP